MIDGWALTAGVTGFFGVVALAAPVWHVAQYGLKHAELKRLESIAAPELKADIDRLSNEVAAIRDSWAPWKVYCLIAGTVLSALSYLSTIAAAF